MLWRKYEFKPLRNRDKVFPCFLGRMDFEIIKHQANLVALGIFVVKYLQKFDIVLAVMSFADQRYGLPSLQIDSREERQGSEPPVLIISADCGVFFIREQIL